MQFGSFIASTEKTYKTTEISGPKLEMKLHGQPIEITRMDRIRKDQIRRELNKEQEQNQLNGLAIYWGRMKGTKSKESGKLEFMLEERGEDHGRYGMEP